MSIRLMTLVWSMESLPSTETLILLSLADQASDEGRCYPSINNICKRTRLSRRTVEIRIDQLVKAGHLTKINRNNSSSVFFVHPQTPGVMVTPPPKPPAADAHPPALNAGHPPQQVRIESPSGNVTESFSSAPPSAGEKKTRKTVVKTGLAEEELPEVWRQYLEGTLADADPAEMFGDFRDHHLKMASRFADWGAAWRTWVRNAAKGLPYVKRSVQSVENNQRVITPAQWRQLQEEKRKARAEGGGSVAVQPGLVG